MEKIKIHILKRAIEETREASPNPIDRNRLSQLMNAIRVCPPQFLRITKMYEEVIRIKENNRPIDTITKIEILNNFQERTTAGY